MGGWGGPKSAEGPQGREADNPQGPTGLRRFEDPAPGGGGPTLLDALRHWELVEADLHERYGIDCDSGILTARTWRWLAAHIRALFRVPPVVLVLPGDKPAIVEVQQTRIGHALFPPRRE